MTRTATQREYHAAKEREYRRLRAAEFRDAVERLRESSATLRRHGRSIGQIVDLLVEPLVREEPKE